MITGTVAHSTAGFLSSCVVLNLHVAFHAISRTQLSIWWCYSSMRMWSNSSYAAIIHQFCHQQLSKNYSALQDYRSCHNSQNLIQKSHNLNIQQKLVNSKSQLNFCQGIILCYNESVSEHFLNGTINTSTISSLKSWQSFKWEQSFRSWCSHVH